MTTRRLAAIICLVLVSVLPAATAEAKPTRAELQASLDRLAREIAITDEDYNVARIELGNVESEIRSTQYNKVEAEKSLGVLRKAASERAVAVYKAGMPDIVQAALTSQSLTEFERRMGVVSRVGEWEAELIAELEVASQKADRRAADLEEELKRASGIKESIAQRRASLQKKISEQKRLLDELARQEAAAAAARQRARLAAAKVKPKPAAQPQRMPESVPASGNARIAVETAYEQIGKPYQWGADGPDSFDCSGLTMFSWRRAGVSLPHSSRAQYSATKRVAREDLEPGDLVFFGSPIHHVGIYIGDGNMINAPETGERVGIRSMNRRDYAGAGRPGV